MRIRPIQPDDLSEWIRMREALWPKSSKEALRAECSDFFGDGKVSRLRAQVFVIARDEQTLGGFVEVTLRPVARGCLTSPVGYVEGWYVDADLRRKGFGKSLIAAAENWAREHSCAEMASDCLSDNHVSHQSHLALGFHSAQRHLHFRKSLSDSLEGARDFIGIVDHPISSETPMQLVTDPAAGGIDIFLGTTRAEKNSNGRDLMALDYQAYEEMALQQIRDLAKRARVKWPIVKLAILHRVGRVAVGDPSVIIAVSTPHRADAFSACKFLIDSLKAEVAIWKKEIWADGSGSWVHPPAGESPGESQ